MEGPPEKLNRLNSCGREHSGHEVCVINQQGDLVAPGEIGEVIIRSEVVMQGYWNNHKATSETVRDGWLYTGDLATVDTDQYLYIVDRKKNMIISGGENIYPKEIEDVLSTHRAVANVCVIGVSDPEWGESPMAIVEPFKEMEIEENEIFQFARNRLSKYKCPRKIVIVDEIPKNTVGKVDIKTVRQMYRNKQ